MLSSKLMTMKFMTNAKQDSSNKDVTKAQTNDAHWQLDFKVPQPTAVSQVIVDPSYSSLNTFDSGRRKFRKNAPIELDEDEEEHKPEPSSNDDEETPEDAFARRQAEREADTANLHKMKGLTSLSGPAKAKRPNLGDKAEQKHKKRQKKSSNG